MFFDFKVRVEVEDNLLVGFRGVDDPFTVLVGGVVIGVPWRGDVPGILGVQAAPAWLSCRDRRERGTETHSGHQVCTAGHPGPLIGLV